MSKNHSKLLYKSGFSLIELVVCIVILGIVSTMSFAMIQKGTDIYIGTTTRTELAFAGRFLNLRLSREFESALPYSFTIANDFKGLTFIRPISLFRIQNFSKNKNNSKYTIKALISELQLDNLNVSKNDCKVVQGVSNYKYSIAYFNQGDSFKFVSDVNLNIDSDNKIVSFEVDDLDIIYNLSANNRIYLLDSCSKRGFEFQNNVLNYQAYNFDTGNKIGNAINLIDKSITVKNVTFSGSGNHVTTGLLLLKLDESVPLSFYTEVRNAP